MPCRTIRGFVLLWLVSPLALVGASPARAQDLLGALAGAVTDSAGTPLPAARVALVGTAFTAVTDDRGRYEIGRVPAGDYRVQVELGEAVVAAVPGVHVPAGATLPLDVALGRGVPGRGPSALDLTSRTRITRARLAGLPVDDPAQALPLAPGVVIRGGDVGIAPSADLSFRGSSSAETGVYIDGTPARSEMFGGQAIPLAASGVEEIAVTTGVPSLLAGDAGGGVVSYVTRSGGERLAGGVRAESDEPFADGTSVGYNRYEGFASGPVPSIRNLTWFTAVSLQGQRSLYRGPGAADQPGYVMAGLDTVVQVTNAAGTVTSVPVPRFVQASGTCGATGGTASPLAAAIQGNYGFACTGLRRPFDWSTLLRGQAKLAYSWGAGSSLSVAGFASGFEQRGYPGQDIGDPGLYSGTHDWSRLVVANWSQTLGHPGGGPLALELNLSRGADRGISGPLTPGSELATRAPAAGIELGTLQFTAADLVPFPLTDALIRNIRTNAGFRVPYLNRTDLRATQPYRINPFAMLSGWPTSGIDAPLTMFSERRLNGRSVLEWRPGHAHVVTLGADAERTDVSFYTSLMTSQISLDGFLGSPRRWGLFAGDHVTLGAAVIELGARYDRLSPGGEFPTTPGRVGSNPAWSPLAATSDTAYANSLARVFSPGRPHDVFSPRLGAAYAFSGRTSVRLAYGQQLNPVPLGLVFGNVNSDLSFTNLGSTLFGRDVAYVKSAVAELGARHAFGEGLAGDLSVYHKTSLLPYDARIEPFPDPKNPGTVINANVLTAPAAADANGVEARVEWRRGAGATGSLSYSYLHANGGAGAGAFEQPPGGVTTQALYATAELRVPPEWYSGAALTGLARDLAALVTFRTASGEPYTRLANDGSGVIAPTNAVEVNAIEAINASRLPWTKTLDLRLTKGLRAGGREWSFYLDFRNLFDFQNTRAVYAETGTVTNDLYRRLLTSVEITQDSSEAAFNGALLPNGAIDLRACATWTAGEADPVNCVMLERAEARFGNGDRIFTRAELQRTLNAYFDSFLGAWRFYGPGRTLRVGVEARF